jgi:type IV pilus assembly protein PilE
MHKQPAASKQKSTRCSARGFTLVELLIALAILTLLAATAYPSYGRYQQRAVQAQAQQVLLDISIAQQQRLLQYGAYLELADSAAVDSGLAVAIPAPLRSHYQFAVVHRLDRAQQFSATATPTLTGRMSGEPALSIDEQGNRLPAEVW